MAFWNGSQWKPIDAGAVRLAVTASGYVTLVTSEGGVSTFALSQPADKSSAAGFWIPLASKPAQVPTSDIAFDPSRNSVWRLDRKKEPGGYGIWKQGDDGSWKQVEGAAVKIALDQQSLPWVINEAGTVYRKSSHDDNAPWVEVPGKARDFVVLPDASLSVLPADQAPGSFALQVWNGERFERR